jgi:phage repressor protein C with HTH and peptisase S24 domain
MDINKRLISGFLSEMKTGKRTSVFQKLLENTEEDIVNNAYSNAIDILEFQTLLLRGPSVREFLNYDFENQYYISSPKPLDRQKQQYSLGNNEKFLMFSDLLNLDAQQIAFARVEGDSMKNANIDDGDIAVVRNSDAANSGDIIVAKIDDNYYIKRYMTIDEHLWLYSDNVDYEPILIPKNIDFSIFGIVCNVIKNIS